VFEPGCAQCYLPRNCLAYLLYGGSSQSIADCDDLEPWKGINQNLKAKNPDEAKIKNNTKTLVIWGAQPSVSQTAQSGRAVAEFRNQIGGNTIVVDPNYSPDAVHATIWLRPRSGADGALVLSWYRYIFENNLFNQDFTKYFTNLPCIVDPDSYLPLFATDVWPDYKQKNPLNTPDYVCYNNKTKKLEPLPFGAPDDLKKTIDPEVFWSGEVTVKGKKVQTRSAGQVYKETAAPYTLEYTEQVSWVPKALNEKAIRLYTNADNQVTPDGPADTPDGKTPGVAGGIANGVFEEMQQIAHQIAIGLMGLDAIMGYVEKPGATLNSHTPALPTDPRPTAPVNGFTGMFGGMIGIGKTIGLTDAENAARIKAIPDQNTLYIQNTLLIDRLGMKNHKGLYHWCHSHIPTVLNAIISGEPYKPRVWFDMSGNKLVVLGNATSWYNAFPQIDFQISQYPMLTSFQMEVADLVFPLEEWLEYAGPSGTVTQMNYMWMQFPILHLGETVSNVVPPYQVVMSASNKLNQYLDQGNDVVIGSVGATVGVSTANPQISSTTVDTDKELQTDLNGSFYHDRKRSIKKDFGDKVRFPVSGPAAMMVGNATDQATRDQVANYYCTQTGAKEGAITFDDLHTYSNYEQWRQKMDDAMAKSMGWCTAKAQNYWIYDQHSQIVGDGLPRGFATESRKFEVYATQLLHMAANGLPFTYPAMQEAVDESIGKEVADQRQKMIAANVVGAKPYEFQGKYSPICQHIEPAESPTEGADGYDANYPLVITSGRVYYFHHGTMRHAAFARELYPAPDVRMNEATATKYGLKHMDWCEVTSRRGSIRGRVYINNGLHDDQLWMERFWNPESYDASQATKSGGWQQENINVITKNTAPFNEVFGSYSNRAFTVNIKPASRPDGVWVEPKEFEPFLPKNANWFTPDDGAADAGNGWTSMIKLSDPGLSNPVTKPMITAPAAA
jgi:anaerobic selenocysteine-containing dehydrogenase